MSNITVRKRHVLPAILSFFVPGLGQLIKGHGYKAIAFFILGIVVGWISTWFWGIPYLIVIVFNIIDALVSNQEEKLF